MHPPPSLVPEFGSLKRMAMLCVLAASLAGCGGTIYFRSPDPTPTPVYTGDLSASPLPTGVDTLTALQKRPMRPPPLAPSAKCPASPTADLGAIAPNYGYGAGPLYLSGQTTWYSGGQVAILMVDSRYSGPLLVRGFQLSGEGLSTVTLQPTAINPTDKEKQHGVAVVPALLTDGGGLYLETAVSSTFWRAWFGRLSTDSPGCFGLQVDGDVFTEFIVFAVQAGIPPPA
jgi:hypothetical protein